MLSPKTWTVIHCVYDNVHAALWAALCAAVLMFLIVVVPQMPKLQAAAETKRLLDVMAENRDYCHKWGMAAGSAKQAQCILDLQRLRAKIKHRIAEESDIF
jgi:hypothetical protein